jgi:hypothetical protein
LIEERFLLGQKIGPRADGIDDAEKFSSDVTNGYAAMFIQLMSVATVNLAAETLGKSPLESLKTMGSMRRLLRKTFLGPTKEASTISLREN